jgi:phosphoenolpyruvate carboxykinase (ATP)
LCSGELSKAQYADYPVFNLKVPVKCTNVPDAVLNPANTWTDKGEYEKTVKKLATLFQDNFKNYASQAEASVVGAGPKF